VNLCSMQQQQQQQQQPAQPAPLQVGVGSLHQQPPATSAALDVLADAISVTFAVMLPA